MTESPACEAHARRYEWFGSVVRLDISPGAKVVAYAITAYVNRATGKANPSHATLGELTRMSTRSVRYALTALADAGLITISDRRGGKYRSCTIRLARLDQIKPFERGQILPRFDEGNVAINDTKRGNPVQQTCTNLADNLPSNLKDDLNGEIQKSFEGRFDGIEYTSTQDDPSWPSGKIRKARNSRYARLSVAREALKILGYNLLEPTRIGGVHVDEFVMQQIPPAALAQIIAACEAGTLDRRDLARALSALRIPRSEQNSSTAHRFGENKRAG